MKKALILSIVLCASGVAASGAAVLQSGAQASVYYREGARFALEGRLEEARSAFEQVIALEPKNADAFYNLGNVYSELGRWEEAVAAYRRAVSLKKGDVEAYNGLGVALSRRGADEQAAAAFERAIEIYPKWAEPYFHLSQVYKKLGRDVPARAAYAEAVRLRPDYAASPPRTFLTVAAKADDAPRTQTQATAANTVTTGGVSRTPKESAPASAPSPSAYAPAAAAPDSKPVVTPNSGATADAAPPRVNQPVAVKPTAGEAASVPPLVGEAGSKSARADLGHARAYYELGLKRSQAGKQEEAIAAFRQAIILDRDDARTYSALGHAYALLGRWRESVDAYEQATRLNPSDASAFERLGRSYAKLRASAPAPPVAGGDGEAATGVKVAAPAGASADASAAREKVAAPGVAPTERDPAAPADPNRAAPTATKADPDPTALYRIGAGDVLDIRVLKGQGPQATSYKVEPSGLLDYPLLAGPLQVAGMTTDELAARLGAELKRRAVAGDAEVSVSVREYASHAVIVSGMVKEPGTKFLRREGVPLYAIIAHAQPLAEAGQALVVSHATGRGTPVDLSDSAAMNLLVRPGDVITVRARPKQYFYIAGAVQSPGQKEFHNGLTLTQAVLAAGGVTSPGAVVAVISRQGGDGRLATNRYNLREIGEGKSQDPAVQPGDRIEVVR